MPVGSPDTGGPTRHPRLRALARWLPVAVLAVVAAAAGTVAAGIEGPPASAGGRAVADLDAPILSFRRALPALRAAAADHILQQGLEQFVAAQPPDTCLDVEVGTFRFSHRVDDPQSPASLQKLLTAVAALTELGADHRFRTEVVAGPVVDGVVTGDLFVRGGGDPVLATGEYAAREPDQPQIFTDVNHLADAVVRAGVRAVTGGVVGDESRFDTVRYSPLWPARFAGQGQIGPLSALSVNDGFAFFFPEDADGAFGPAPDPAAYAAEVLARALRARGVLVLGPSRSAGTPAELDVLADVESPPLRDIVAQMLRESDNNTAELLLKELGRQHAGAGTFAAGQTAVAAALADAGLAVDAIAVADGSGLSTDDVVTCAAVAEVLAVESTRDVLADALPVGGESGTLRDRFAGPETAGRVRAKTGTLNQVTGLAGYVDSAGGDDARFALLVNVPPSDRVQIETIAAQERLVELLAAHPDLPDVTGLAPR